jgi:hypothetical protein
MPHTSHLPSIGSPNITWCLWVSDATAGIAGSDPSECMDIRPLRVSCMLRPMQLADPSFRGVLPAMCVCVCVCVCV